MNHNDIRMKNRMLKINKRAINRDNAITFGGKVTRKDCLKLSYYKAQKALNLIMNGDLSQIYDLSQHLFFIEEKSYFDQFCSAFPFNIFFDYMIQNETFSIYAIIIISKLIESKHFPLQSIVNLSYIQQLNKIQIENGFDTARHIIKILTKMIMYSNEENNIRDYLLNNGYIQFILSYCNNNKVIPSAKKTFLINSSCFILNCMRTQPLLANEIATNLKEILFSFLSSEDDNIVLAVLQNYQSNPLELYPSINDEILNIIMFFCNNTTSGKIGLFTYHYMRNIPSLEYLNLTIQYLQRFNSEMIQKKCLKTMIKRKNQWNTINNEDVCQILIHTAETSSFATKRLCTKALIYYWDIHRLIDYRILELLINFVNDRKVSILFIESIIRFLSSPFPTSDIQHVASHIWNEDTENKLSDLMENGNEKEMEAASILMNFMLELFNDHLNR